MDLIKDIMRDLDKYKKIIFQNRYDFIFLHYSLGLYIRNKYIWENPKNFEFLKNYFSIDDADGISLKLIKLYLTKNSSPL